MKYLIFVAYNTCKTVFDKISQQPENWENRNGLDLVQAFPKK
jgi:hypothetical protein